MVKTRNVRETEIGPEVSVLGTETWKIFKNILKIFEKNFDLGIGPVGPRLRPKLVSVPGPKSWSGFLSVGLGNCHFAVSS